MVLLLKNSCVECLGVWRRFLKVIQLFVCFFLIRAGGGPHVVHVHVSTHICG